ncbi:MAG: TIGR00153 family protein [Proteobacteria bacterium]|nr:TIGR00153 family protein [Pseudomonadota bacterium]MBU1639166.1 TIGR00153 family protein [Pseudomonadota bacterium]
MTIIGDLLGNSPIGHLVDHARKVHECVELVKPMIEALIAEDWEWLNELHDRVSKTEYEADQIKHDIRDNLPRRYFLPVNREELDGFLQCQEKMADYAEDFSVIATIRKTRLHEDLHELFMAFVTQVFQVSGTLLTAAVEFKNLAEVSFSGAEARMVLGLINRLGEEEWKADKLGRKLSMAIYELENKVSPFDIIFCEKMLLKLSDIANEAENAGDFLRAMLRK